MLKYRILTAAILIPLVLGGIFYLPTEYFAIALGLFVAQGAWEWTRLIGLQRPTHRVVYVAVVVSLLLNAYQLLLYPEAMAALLALSVLWWLAGLVRVARYRGETGIDSDKWLLNAVYGGILLVPTWLGLLYLHSDEQLGAWRVLLLMLLIWGADSGAYFAGRKFGKHKLAPYVSPGKTWEGVAGGFVTSLIIATVGGLLLELQGLALGLFIGLAALTVMLSVEGDLMESLYKRRAGVKDSGQLLPGHGGVLDRIDSMTAAAPLFALGLLGLEVVI